MSENEIVRLVDSGSCVEHPKLGLKLEREFGYFYAPFDWVNDDADIVLIGITPGRQQAKKALITLRAGLIAGSIDAAAADAKQAASFDGEMRKIAAMLMNRFDFHKLFGLADCSELFDSASHRVHYTSILRYPVLQRKELAWINYSGSPNPFSTPLLMGLFEEYFSKEATLFGDAWLVPFGPIPAEGLKRLAKKGLVRADRILGGLNHPSGTQWNRHNCQLNVTQDHSGCSRNVGCEKLRTRSNSLEGQVSRALGRVAR